MRRLLILLVCSLSVLLLLSGCQGSAANKSGVDVIVEGGGEFPEFLVGRWKDEKRGWEFVFEPGGTISSAVIDAGSIRVTPSKKVTTIELKDGGKAVYKLGQWTVQYSPENRELTVEIVVDHFQIDMGSYGMEGCSTDLFVGPISEDSQSWEAEWLTFPEYTALTPEPVDFPVDPNDNPIDTLVFRKQRETN